MTLRWAGAGLAVAAAGARAQPIWKPGKPVKIVVPFAPGGGADASARLVAKGLGERLAQTVYVENRAGASGAIGTDYVYAAPPDGSVLLAATGDAQAVAPHLTRMRADTLKFVPLAGITLSGFVLMGRQSLPAADLQELLALGRRQSLSYSSAGSGTAIHVVTAAFGQTAGLEPLLHVPYQGGGPAIQALLAGEVDLMMVPGSIAGAYLSKARAYGYTAAKRNRFMTAVPTLPEQGVQLVADSWTGIVAPPGTQPNIAAALAQAVYDTVNESGMQKLFQDQSRESFQLDRAQFARYYADEYEHWGRMIKKAGVKVD